MSFLKPVIILAMSTALTACASAPNAAADLTEAKAGPNAASIKLVADFKTNSPVGTTPFYMICKGECDRSKFSTNRGLGKLVNFFPLDSKETKETRVTAGESVEVIAGVKYSYSPQLSSGFDGQHNKACTQSLEFTPKSGKSYQVTLIQEDKQSCHFELTEG